MQAAIQAAIFAQVSTLGYPTYDHVPQGADFPYVVIGDDTAQPYDTDDSVGAETTCTIHVWSRYRGRKEAKDICAAIYGKLHRKDFPVAGAALIECQAEFEQTLLDPDGLTRHGIIRFRITTETL